ncbi:putative membrane protein [Janthinobacterium agaricidamnosum NBRC 102515 = DSM 9628]|uniref:Putative membrane protein n=1 Tax=Janthinobacterium agaricidamnosum NBRC 102515 = DSM 9628 TaxID=1349767 RepID=W0V4P7_9BURK|nr:putative membrane protein [Janthinobacterium agaricidamnosum NBRC 102515 = DSM 9628]
MIDYMKLFYLLTNFIMGGCLFLVIKVACFFNDLNPLKNR